MSEACPPPPSHLPQPLSGEIREHSGHLLRVIFRGGPHPCDWFEGRTDGPLATARFDHHDHQEPASVMYLATKGGCATES